MNGRSSGPNKKPNILSEITFHDLRIYETRAATKLTWQQYFIRGSVGYGDLLHGKEDLLTHGMVRYKGRKTILRRLANNPGAAGNIRLNLVQRIPDEAIHRAAIGESVGHGFDQFAVGVGEEGALEKLSGVFARLEQLIARRQIAGI